MTGDNSKEDGVKMVQKSVQIPEHLDTQINENKPHGWFSETVRDVVRERVDTSMNRYQFLQDRLDEYREKMDMLEAERDDLNERIKGVSNQITEIQHELNEIEEQREDYQKAIERVMESVSDMGEPRMINDHKKLKRVSQRYGKSLDTVRDDLRELGMEFFTQEDLNSV